MSPAESLGWYDLITTVPSGFATHESLLCAFTELSENEKWRETQTNKQKERNLVFSIFLSRSLSLFFFLTHHQKLKNYKCEGFAHFLQQNINFLTVKRLQSTQSFIKVFFFFIFTILFLINFQFPFFTSFMFCLPLGMLFLFVFFFFVTSWSR